MSSRQQSIEPYTTANAYWPTGGTITIRDESGQLLLVLPVEFLRLGRVQNAGYALEQVQSCFEQEGELVDAQPTGAALQPDDPIQAGEYLFRRNDKLKKACQPRLGPRSKLKYRAPSAEERDASTMSNSKRSSMHQSGFLFDLAARDGWCIVSKASLKYCTASHILPMTRPEYYAEALHPAPPAHNLFHASFGLLLRDDLHHAFDRLELALWPLPDGKLIVHFFLVEKPLLGYHGKVIDPEHAFRSDPSSWPRVELLRFHYRQCAMRFLRGWSYFPPLPQAAGPGA